MNALYVDPTVSDDGRRQLLFNGQLLVYSPRPTSLALIEWARELIREAFNPLDPLTAQHHLSVERYIEILTALKPRFINHPTSKQLLQKMLEDMGCDRDKTYFDVPRMRTSTSDKFLTSGIAYAFHPHRDTWYSAPMCQINWWIPIFTVQPDNAMAFHCQYWDAPVANESQYFNYYEYVQTARKDAAKHVKEDTRKQPHPVGQLELDPQLRVITKEAGLLLFSAAHLHSSVPNTSGYTRFSIDFRTVHEDDVATKVGAPNLDSACTGTSLRDFYRVSDLGKLPEELVLPHENVRDICPAFKSEAGVMR
jgi:hypothetical protein